MRHTVRVCAWPGDAVCQTAHTPFRMELARALCGTTRLVHQAVVCLAILPHDPEAQVAKTTIQGGKGQQSVSFSKGGLHRSTHTPEGATIPDSKMRAAARGDYGPKAVTQANMARGMLRKGRQTAARNRSRRR